MFGKTNQHVWALFGALLLLPVLDGCDKAEVSKVPVWAENSMITTDGRLFVSGATNIYEVVKDEDGTFVPHPLYNKTEMFMGLAQRGDYLYAIIGGNTRALLIADLNSLSLDPEQNASEGIFTIIPLSDYNLPQLGKKTFQMPNGMCIDDDGYIYITDESAGRIMRFHIVDNDPTQIEDLVVWIDTAAHAPNGIAIKGDTLYFTECLKGEVKKVEIQADGSPGDISVLYTRPCLSIFDDLAIFGQGVMVASCGEGKVIYISDGDDEERRGKVLFETSPQTFLIPTSVSVGRAPMFGPGDLIVTEGGGGNISLIHPALPGTE